MSPAPTTPTTGSPTPTERDPGDLPPGYGPPTPLGTLIAILGMARSGPRPPFHPRIEPPLTDCKGNDCATCPDHFHKCAAHPRHQLLAGLADGYFDDPLPCMKEACWLGMVPGTEDRAHGTLHGVEGGGTFCGDGSGYIDIVIEGARIATNVNKPPRIHLVNLGVDL